MERKKAENEERKRQKKELLKKVSGEKDSADDAKKAAIEAAMARVKAKRDNQSVTPANMNNLTDKQKKEIAEIDFRVLGNLVLNRTRSLIQQVNGMLEGMSRWIDDPDWMETVDFINSKNNFMWLADELGVTVPQTQCFDRVDEISEMDIVSFNMPCYLKAAISVSGVGIYRCANREELRSAMEKFDSDVPVQLQEEVKTDVFLNLQYRVINGRLLRMAASEQVLDGCAHQGNRYPSTYAPWDVVDPMAHWLKDRGIKGIFAFDVAVIQTDDGVRFSAIECNPRFNGASYPTVIAQKLDIPEWSALTFKTRHRNFSDLNLQDLEFNMKTGEGLVIVNWGTLLEGKLVLLLAGSAEYRQTLANELTHRL